MALIKQEIASEASIAAEPAFDYVAWFRDVEVLRQQIHASHGDLIAPADVIEILRDIRDDKDE